MLFFSRLRLCWLAMLLACVSSVSAQLKITYPVSRMVVQRNNNNQATVQIAGSYAQTLDLVEAHVVARAQGQGTTTNWTTLQTNPTNGQFNGTIPVTGGWYRIEVRGKLNGQVVAADSVDRFGVGEVFAIMGHSNAQGSSCYVKDADNNIVDKCHTIAGAFDDRVSVITLDESTPSFNQYLNTANSDLLPAYPTTFSKLPKEMGGAPFGHSAWLWGRFGDQLTARINVPVLLYNAGFGGSNMQQTYWAANNIYFEHGFIKYSIRMPYANIRNMMNLYIPATGIRAFLILHGENDRGNPTDSTAKYYQGVIEKIRSEANKPTLAMIVSYSSYFGGVDYNVRAAEALTIQNVPQCYAGPDLDQINSLDDRPDGGHYSNASGQAKAGDAWAASVTDNYLSTIIPYEAEQLPLTSLACAGSGQLTLTAPASVSSTWSTGVYTPSITAGSGTYSVRTHSATNKIQFSPAVVVPGGVTPVTPTITTSTGTTAICQSSMTLTASAANVIWNTSATSSLISVSTPGTYSVQALHPAYGCLSGTASTAIGLAPADIALGYQVSRRVVSAGDMVTLQLSVQNRSGCDVGPLRWQAPLPSNVAFVSSPLTLTNTNGTLFGSIPSMSAFTNSIQNYTVRVLAEGTYQYRAELLSSTNPTPNATPGNGNGNGEVDETATDVRTLSGGSFYASANPNQVSLPAVQSNQPVPDPSKADLSLAMKFNSRAVAPGTPVSLSLIVTNTGGLAATSVSVGSTLPAGLIFVSSPSGMVAAGQQLSGQIASIPVGQSVQLVVVVSVTQAGYFSIPAQITASAQSDPDSTPGNGYLNGEDDTVSVDLRTQY